MIRLTREIRFSLVDREIDSPMTNSWGGWPSATVLAPYLRLQCTVEGEPETSVGYVCNVKDIDIAVRRVALPTALDLYHREGNSLKAERLCVALAEALRRELPLPLARLELVTTPTLRYALDMEKPDMISMTQQFEFSAAHRLHCAELSDEENRQQFGKCNNENGHGHNYRLDVTIAQPHDESRERLSLIDVEAIVKRQVVDRFDHKHLNEDTEEFRALNPTIENIAVIIWRLLADELAPARLEVVRVYETPKTWAECRGG